MLHLFTSIAMALLIIGKSCDSARILAVFPVPSISHQVVFRRLTIELAERGHELVIFTSDPVRDPKLKNYTEYDMHHTYGLMTSTIFKYRDDYWEILRHWNLLSKAVADAVLSSKEMRSIIDPKTNEHFDLILVEYFTTEAIYGLMKRFNAPMVGITSMPLLPTSHYAIGNPLSLAYSPGIEVPLTDEMNFWERLSNAYFIIRGLFVQYTSQLVMQDELLKKHFGPDMPFVGDLAADVSLILVNSHPILSYPQPNLPGIIGIGGISLNRTLKGLDSDLKRFLDGASKGFVYFSLGSNAKSESLPKDKLNAFIDAFAELPYRILWKWETDTLRGKPDNVFISKWLPQYDVLAHPNIKAFVYQGGLQSTEEAIDNAVPLIGIPIFGDQEFNVLKIQSAGIGKRIGFNEVSREKIRDTIIEVITNESYKEKIVKFREMLNDQPENAVQRAVWWTEYVIRHNGTPHLQTRVRKLSWYQRELLDVFTFIIVVLLSIIYVSYKITSLILKNLLKPAKSTRSMKFKVK